MVFWETKLCTSKCLMEFTILSYNSNKAIYTLLGIIAKEKQTDE